MKNLKNWNWDAMLVWGFILTVSYFFWKMIFNFIF